MAAMGGSPATNNRANGGGKEWMGLHPFCQGNDTDGQKKIEGERAYRREEMMARTRPAALDSDGKRSRTLKLFELKEGRGIRGERDLWMVGT